MRRMIPAAIASVAVLAAAPVTAQTFPSRPLELVVHTSAGGGTDLFARAVADIITKEKLVTQPVNVVNRPGGGGAIAYNYIKSRLGEPHTIMAVATLALLTQTLRPELGINMEHFTPIAFVASDPQAIMVPADSPYRTMKDLIDAGKSGSGTIVASVTSPGGSGRMLVFLLERETGAKFKTVSFKSGGDAIIQVMGGHTQFTTENISEGYGAVQGRKLRVLAVTSLKRLPIVPDAPTLMELGIKLHVGTGRGFAMPGGVPKEAAAHMESVIERVYHTEQWKEHSEKNMFERIWMGSADYAKHLAQRRIDQEQFLRAVGIIGSKP
ncbi:MAG: tripartite tricarboxylate transporter substrate binding protein [Burkholderiales bacterium]|nr:tripartite tricarboxylate transporter substrate binding protein [Burkholderiales bacterium]